MKNNTFFKSSLGDKVIMAISALVLIGFVVLHMIGNLQIFVGPEKINNYAAFLHSEPLLLWGTRVVMVVAVLAHAITGLRLAAHNRAARPERYVANHTLKATLTSRTMALTGLTVLAFIIFHLLHFTLGVVQPEYYGTLASNGHTDVYSMVVHGFQNPAIAISYIVAMLLLGMHLSHGIGSLFESLGLSKPKYSKCIKQFSQAVTAIIILGNCSMPIAVLAGFIKLTGGH